MRVDILTLFPTMFAPLNESMMWKARQIGALELHLHDIRAWATDAHRTVDDAPYGGGGGMVMRVDVLGAAIEAVRGSDPVPVVLMSAQGQVFHHNKALELAQLPRLILVCGHYEGVDERVIDLFIDEQISIGDYVLTGGELAAMVVVDAVVRQLPGVLGAEGGVERESHADGLLEGPHYTRPSDYRGLSVPAVLREGNHAAIERWRRREAIRRTWRCRPELLRQAPLTPDEVQFLAELAEEDARRALTRS
ncbi:MAG: tRNA (guanosine(37)-N1)-methyltransferase TrmD [Anaerolineae bacterium]|nr:tRNA (guanosine(37)-N1)-methyltransferase TrmD [Anaerolineae bacterium]MDW8171225.1 tRNA (guanosine(37)-N1)-methyltransferase TrmD [Anaerolineae bacterium]